MVGGLPQQTGSIYHMDQGVSSKTTAVTNNSQTNGPLRPSHNGHLCVCTYTCVSLETGLAMIYGKT